MKLLLVWIITLFSIQPLHIPCGEMAHYPVATDSVISQQFGHLGHVGADFKIPVGTPVYADMNGVVDFAVEDSRIYGRSIGIIHDYDGYEALYAHLSKLLVKQGDKVYAGQVIALSGGDPNDKIDGDGSSSGAHLHYEIRVPNHLDNNLYNIDPLKYINQKLNKYYFCRR